MRIPHQPIGAGLCAITPQQALLIKSRLYFYREGLGSAPAKSWAHIALRISTLPYEADMPLDEREHLIERYRYYLLSRTLRGREKPTDADVRDAAFAISDDTLHRWYHGQYDESRLGGKKDYVPSPQVIAAIRDFLLFKGHLSEADLNIDHPALNVIFSLNAFFGRANYASAKPVPQLPASAISYDISGEALVFDTVAFESIDAAGYVRFCRETHKYPIPNGSNLRGAIDRASGRTPSETATRTGWIALGPSPVWLAFHEADVRAGHRPEVEMLTLASLRGGAVAIFKLASAASFDVDGDSVLPPRADTGGKPFVSNDFAGKIEYFEEFTYNIQERPTIKDFYASNSVEEILDRSSDENSGKALFEQLSKIWRHFRASSSRMPFNESWSARDEELPFEMIQSGADVNYRDPITGVTVLHRTIGLNDVIEVLMERDDLNYLVKTAKGLTPADCAFQNHQPELGMRLSKKMAEQARRDGIDLADFLAAPPDITPVPSIFGGLSAFANGLEPGELTELAKEHEDGAIIPGERWGEAEFQSGQALYDAINRLLTDELDQLEHDLPAQVIAQGSNVNYTCPRTGDSPLHLAASIAHGPTLDALLAHPDVNYLVKDRQGQTAADIARDADPSLNLLVTERGGLSPEAYAAMLSARYAKLLTEKMEEQARREGVDLAKFLAAPVAPPSPEL